jgi:hypothetical protein
MFYFGTLGPVVMDVSDLPDRLVPLFLGHDLALVVVGVVAHPVQGYRGRQHCVRDGKTVAYRQSLRTKNTLIS